MVSGPQGAGQYNEVVPTRLGFSNFKKEKIVPVVILKLAGRESTS